MLMTVERLSANLLMSNDVAEYVHGDITTVMKTKSETIWINQKSVLLLNE